MCLSVDRVRRNGGGVEWGLITLNSSSVCKEERKIGTDKDLSKLGAKDRPNSKKLNKSSVSAPCFGK